MWCGCASVVPGEGCTYMCVCALHLLCVVGVTYVICGYACIEHAHMQVCHTSVQRCCVCACESTYVHTYNTSCLCLYASYCVCMQVTVSVCKLLCLYVSYCLGMSLCLGAYV